MSETTHTPLPWIVSAPGIIRIGGEPIRCREIGAKKASGWIAIIQDEPNAGQSGDDNASLIARAVNSHAALVEALRLADVFVAEELAVRESSLTPNPTEDEARCIGCAETTLEKIREALRAAGVEA